jgi:hypothetical protein
MNNKNCRKILKVSAAIFYSTWLCMLGCTKTSNPMIDESGGALLYVIGSDYQTGVLQRMGVKDTALSPDYLQVFQDSRIRFFGGMLYILESSTASNLMKVDPSNSGQSGVVYQKHLGTNMNPVDIKFISEHKAYISCENNPSVLIVDPYTGTVTGAINITRFAYKADGVADETNPHAGRMVLENGLLYVGLQRLDSNYQPGAKSLILVINTVNDSILDTIQLNSKNIQDLKIVDGKMYASCPGEAYGTIGDGDIESVDLSSRSVATIIDETALHGNPNAIIHKTGSLYYVQTYIAWGSEKIFEVDFSTGRVVDSIPDVIDAFGGVFYDEEDSLLFVGERASSAAGIKVFKNNKLIHGPITNSKSLPPYGFEMATP